MDSLESKSDPKNSEFFELVKKVLEILPDNITYFERRNRIASIFKEVVSRNVPGCSHEIMTASWLIALCWSSFCTPLVPESKHSEYVQQMMDVIIFLHCKDHKNVNEDHLKSQDKTLCRETSKDDVNSKRVKKVHFILPENSKTRRMSWCIPKAYNFDPAFKTPQQAAQSNVFIRAA